MGVLLALTVGACAEAPLASCTDPPESELRTDSWLELSVAPVPLAAGDRLILTVSAEGDTVGASAAFWECWDGSQWLITHLMVLGETTGAVEEPGVEPLIQAVGLIVPYSDEITIPEVPQGVYRIRMHGTVTPGEDVEGESVEGLLVVEVR